MKHTLFILAVLFSFSTACSSMQDADNEDTNNWGNEKTTTVKFENPQYDFGVISQGEVVLHTFKYKNTGNGSLVITDITTSCGCTATKWDKEPLRPNETAEIEVKFDSYGKMGTQSKSITIIANTEPIETTLQITGMVEIPAK